MLRYLLARTGQLLPVLLGVTLLTFAVLHAIPGDPAALRAGVEATESQLAAIRAEMGLTRPLYAQYLGYLGQVLQGDFGESFRSGQPVGPELLRRFGFTFSLSLLSMGLALLIGIPAGVAAALTRTSWRDTMIMVLAMVSLSMPTFWLALILLQIFAGGLGWLPAGGSGTWRHLVLPAVVLGTGVAAVITRITRSSMIDVLSQDYIRTLTSAGLSRTRIIYRHALRNALNPVITMASLQFGFLLAGAVIVEVVFSLPGIGRMVVMAIFNRDYPIVQGGLLLLAGSFVAVNLVSDVLYALANPRIRYGRS